MQILYCDDCGMRVDETEAVASAGKNYCQQCAPKHVAVHKSGGVATLPVPPRSTRAQRLPRTTPVRNLATGAGAPISAHGVDTRYVASHNAKADRESQDFSDDRRYAPPAPTGLAAITLWAQKNSAIALVTGCAVVGVLVMLASHFFGSNSASKASQNKAPSNPSTYVAPSNSSDSHTNATIPAPSTAVDASIGKIPGVLPKTFEPDPRTDKATRDLNVIKEQIATGKANPFDMHKRLERFLEPFWIRKTPLGQEAAALMQKMVADKRPADQADGAVPGISVGVANIDTFNSDFNSTENKTLTDINLGSADALKSATGRSENVALKFTGFITVPAEGDYTFYVNSDDGSILYLGDTLLVDNGGSHPMMERDGTISLKAGKHRFRLEYFQGASQAGCILSWTGPGIPSKQAVPASAFSSLPK